MASSLFLWLCLLLGPLSFESNIAISHRQADLTHVLSLKRREDYAPNDAEPLVCFIVQGELAIPASYTRCSRTVAYKTQAIDEVSDNIALISTTQIVVHPRQHKHGDRLFHPTNIERDKEYYGYVSQEQSPSLSC